MAGADNCTGAVAAHDAGPVVTGGVQIRDRLVAIGTFTDYVRGNVIERLQIAYYADGCDAWIQLTVSSPR